VRSAHTVAVWGPFIRIGHWLLAASILIAWLTRTGARTPHEWSGYVALALVAARTVWGFVGIGHARFASFVRDAPATWSYAIAVLQRREPRHMGHNPLGAYMIVLLLLATAATGVTGWLYTTDRYWGIEWVENLHSTLADLLLVLIALHVAGVIGASLRHRENLIAAMLHGRKRSADDD
jgi:cytochrome b